MLKRSSYLNTLKQIRAGLRLVFSFSFAIFFGLLFAWQQSSAFTSNRIEPTLISKGAKVLLSGYLFNDYTFSLHLPFDSPPLPDGPGVPCDSESEEDFENDFNPWIGHYPLTGLCNLSFQVSSIPSTAVSLQNRTRVPFFILYHSWKSFLS